jgi:transglycosylase-like protein with SLT domain
MNPVATKILFAILLTALSASVTATRTTSADPDAAWKAYLKNDTQIAPSYRFPHGQCFKAAAVAHDLPETLLLAVARGESDFKPTAKSKANAHGVMQILWPGTANHLGIYRLSELYDPCTNIDAGARYLKELLLRFDGNLHLALAAYNYGPGRIEADISSIPSGARWYSDYIFRHLGYVLGDKRSGGNRVEQLYSDLGRSVLLRFAEPYRADAFVTRLEQRSPTLQLDWFREDVGSFVVVLTYEDREQFKRSARLLANAGFQLE